MKLPKDGTISSHIKPMVSIALIFTLVIPQIVWSTGITDQESPENSENLSVMGTLDHEGETGRVPWHIFSFGIVDLWTGNLFISQRDLSLRAKGFNMEFSRSYNSFHRDVIGPLGRGWTHRYNARLILNGDGSVVLADWDGSTANYTSTGGGDYDIPAGFSSRLTHYDSDYVLWKLDGGKKVFNTTGSLLYIEDRNGNRVNLAYSGNMLTRIADSSGQSMNLTYNAFGRISRIDDSSGRNVSYTYDASGDLLETVSYSSGNISYSYYASDTGLMNHMVDRNHRVLEFNYALESGEKRLSSIANSVYDPVNDTYAPPYSICTISYDYLNSTTTESIRGRNSTYIFDSWARISSRTDPIGRTWYYNWTSNNRISNISMPSGALYSYYYDSYGNPERIINPLGDEESMSWQVLDNSSRYQALLMKRTDMGGGRTEFTYDSRGNPLEISASSLTYRYTYNSDGTVHNLTYPGNRTTGYAYDTHGWATSITDPCGNTTYITYDSIGRRKSITLPEGNKYGFTYDDNDRISSLEMPDGNTSTFVYDAMGNLINMTDRAGNSVRYELGFLNIPSVINRGSTEEKREYNGNGNMVKFTDALGNAWNYEYDDAGRMTASIDPLGNREEFVYDVSDNVIAHRDKNGVWAHYEYDLLGNVVEERDALGEVTTYEYDATGRLLRRRDPLGHTTTYSYDGLGRLIRKVNPDGGTTSLTYDKEGHVSSVMDENGASTSFEYDACGRLIRKTDDLGSSISIEYDGNGMPVSVEDAMGKTRYYYDVNGMLVGIRDASGNLSAYTYDSCGNLISYTDFSGNTEHYAYDGFNRLISTTDALGDSTSYEYDAMGRVVSVKDPAGYNQNFTYDAVGNLISATDRTGNLTEYSYDAMGRVISITDALDHSRYYEYDAAGRIISETDADGLRSFYSYDAAGNLLSVRDRDGYTTNYEYDASDRVVRMADAGGYSTEYSYDVAGNPVSITDALGNTWNYEYDALDRVINRSDPLGNRVSYGYDAVGNLISVCDSRGANSTYSYDSLSRIISATDPLGNTVHYEYDAMGRVTTFTDALGNSTEYAYDALGNLKGYTDALGNVWNYSYDKRGLLSSVTDPLGNHENFTYDGEGRLSTYARKDGGIFRYSYDGVGNIISVVDPLGNSTYYSYDAVNRLTGISNGYYSISLLYDGEGNIRRYTDGNGYATEYERDYSGRIARVLYPDGSDIQYQYDAVGNEIKNIYASGAVFECSYDAIGRVLSITDALNHSTAYSYDDGNSTVRVTDRRGFSTTYHYNLLGRMTERTDALGHSTTYSYDALGRPVSITDALNHSTTYSYDAMGRTTEIRNPLNHSTRYSYDAFGNIVNMTDSRGFGTEYSYDSMGRLIKTRYSDGNESTYAYDLMGNLIESVDQLGHSTLFAYDSLYRTVSITDALGNSASYEYNGNDMVSAHTDAMGGRTEFQYDSMGRVISVRDALGNLSHYSYNSMGKIATYTDRTGAIWSYSYDLDGRLVSITDPLGNSTQYGYDEEGNMINATDRTGNSWTYSYDALGRPVDRTCPLGFSTRYSYDAMGNLISITDALNHSTTYSYDAAGNMLSIIDPMGYSSNFTYDSVGNMLSARNPRGYLTNYTYDSIGRIIRVEFPSGNYEEYGYDSMGNIVWKGDANGDRVEYHYDAVYNLIGTGFPDGKSFNYSYDAMGNLINATGSAAAANLSFAYDALGRVRVQSIDFGGFKKDINMSYDAEGRLIAYEVVQDSLFVNYSRDTLGRLISIWDGSGYVNFTYDAEGRRASLTYPDGSYNTYSWNGAGLIQNLTERNSTGSVVSWFNHTYNGIGQLVSLRSADGVSNYTYNSNGWLTSVDDGTDIWNFVYDKNGNIVSETTGGSTVTSTYDDNDRLVSCGSANYSWDSAGRLTQISDGSVTAYGWYYTNALNSIASSVNTYYGYDPMGKRVYTDNGTEVYHLNLMDNGIADMNSTGSITSHYIFGDKIDEPYEMLSASAYVYRYNSEGSIIALDDISGTRVLNYTYTVFGEGSASGNLSVINPYRYEGRRYDPDHGIYDYRARFYLPEMKRFVSMDPLGLKPGLNPYMFSKNDPIKYDDPYGKDCTDRDFKTVKECLACVDRWEKKMKAENGSPKELDKILRDHIESKAKHKQCMAFWREKEKKARGDLKRAMAEFRASEKSIKSLRSPGKFFDRIDRIVGRIKTFLLKQSVIGLIDRYNKFVESRAKKLIDKAGRSLAQHLLGIGKTKTSSGKNGISYTGLEKLVAAGESSIKEIRGLADMYKEKARSAAGIGEHKPTYEEIKEKVKKAWDMAKDIKEGEALGLTKKLLVIFFETHVPGQWQRMSNALNRIAGALHDIEYAKEKLRECTDSWDEDKYQSTKNMLKREIRERKERWHPIIATANAMRVRCRKEKRAVEAWTPPPPGTPTGPPQITHLRRRANNWIMWDPPPNWRPHIFAPVNVPGAREPIPADFFGPGSEVIMWDPPFAPVNLSLPTGPPQITHLRRRANNWIMWDPPSAPAPVAEKQPIPGDFFAPGSETFPGKLVPGELLFPLSELLPNTGRPATTIINPHKPEPLLVGGFEMYFPEKGEKMGLWGESEIINDEGIYFPRWEDTGLIDPEIGGGYLVTPGSHGLNISVHNYGDADAGPLNISREILRWERMEEMNESFESGVSYPWSSDPPNQWVTGNVPHTGSYSAELSPGSLPESALICDMSLNLSSIDSPVLSFWFTTSGAPEPCNIELRASVNGGIATEDFTEILYSFDPFSEPGNSYASPLNISLSDIADEKDVRIAFFAVDAPVSASVNIDDVLVYGDGWESESLSYINTTLIGAGNDFLAEFPVHTFMDGCDYRAVFASNASDHLSCNDVVDNEFSCGLLTDVSVSELNIETLSGEPLIIYDRDRTMTALIRNSGNMPADAVVSAHLGTEEVLFYDEMESGEGMWMPATQNWTISDSHSYSPPHSWMCSMDGISYGEMWHESLSMNPLDLSDPAIHHALLSFRHGYDLDGGDGANVKVSVDGALWDVVQPSEGYDGVIVSGNDNPMEGEEAFSGRASWQSTYIDLDPYLGNSSVYIRFDMGTDSKHTENSGWFVDDVSVTALREYQELPVTENNISFQGGCARSESRYISTTPFTFPYAGTWTVWFEAEAAGDENFVNNLLSMTVNAGEAWELQINEGWNLISIPWQTSTSSVEDALSEIPWDRAMVYADGAWRTYNRNRDARYNLGFLEIDSRIGIWVNATSNGALRGPHIPTGRVEIGLHTGWNLVGCPCNTEKNVSEALSGVPYLYVQTANETGAVITLADADTMTPGRGYWIYVISDCIWTVYW